MIIPHKCPYCDHMFYNNAGNEADLQSEKYEHLAKHDEFKKDIDRVIGDYPNIKKYVKIKYDAQFNKNRNTHQFIQILYNHGDPQYIFLLEKFETLLKKYANYLEGIQENIISNKTLSDFLAFYSELEVMERLEETFNEQPNIFKSDNNQNADFILHNKKLIVEVKTPLESKKRLFEYVQEWRQQKQLKELGNEYPEYFKVLIINSKYNYPIFGEIQGFKIFSSDRTIFWDACIAYNNFNGDKSNIVLNEQIKDLIDKLTDNLLKKD